MARTRISSKTHMLISYPVQNSNASLTIIVEKLNLVEKKIEREG